MFWRVCLGAAACAVVAAFGASVRADESKSALEREPAGWADILPGEDLGGWTRLPVPFGGKLHGDVAVWKVDKRAGILDCRGNLPADPDPEKKGGSHEFFRYDRELRDFIFHVEWRFVDPNRKGWNSGVFVRNSADGKVWHQAQIGYPSGGYWFGETPDADGTAKRVNLKAREERIKKVGEWNTFEITARGDKMSLWVNGADVCDWEGLRVKKGYIGLEAEYHPIEFRNLKLKEAGSRSP